MIKKRIKRVSLKDIAEKVGVSTALVSYVLNGQEKEKRVGAEVVLKIRKVAKQMNYVPNQIARSLRKGVTKTIGLVVADIANPFFGAMARIIEDEANRFGYTVVFGSSDEDSNKSNILVDTLLNRQVDGFIIVPSEGCNDCIRKLVKNEMPVVLVDRYFPDIITNYVVLNNRGASFEAVSHLIEKGFRQIGMIAYRSTMIHMQERIRGYEEAMRANGLEKNIRIKYVRYDNVNVDTEKAIREMTARGAKIDALFFANNTLSIAGLYYINKNNIKIPESLGLIAFDESEAFDFFYCPLTYVKQPVDEMGKEAVNVLVEQINGSKKIAHIELIHQLVKRQSCR